MQDDEGGAETNPSKCDYVLHSQSWREVSRASRPISMETLQRVTRMPGCDWIIACTCVPDDSSRVPARCLFCVRPMRNVSLLALLSPQVAFLLLQFFFWEVFACSKVGKLFTCLHLCPWSLLHNICVFISGYENRRADCCIPGGNQVWA